ncbi:hypothetical protein SLE2022_155550 [Rubroshorea leprosula]
MALHNLAAALCFVGLALITIFVPCFGSAAPSPTYSQDSPEAYLNAHNTYRAAVGVPPIIWDKKVAAYAQNYANQRIRDCQNVHSGGPYGENIATSNGERSGTDAVMMWIKEKDDYDFESHTCAEGKVCSHFTQVLCSILLGCAKARCNSGGTFIVCNYDPPGNLVGELPTSEPPIVDPVIEDIPLQGRKKKITGVLVGSIVGACVLFSGFGFFVFFFWRKGKGSVLDELAFNVSFGDELGNDTGPREFSYNELSKATKNFAEEEKLGEGGFGSVYKGLLRGSNSYVAVKRVSRRSRQGIKEFTSEVKIISKLKHKNLVKLIGWCHEKELLLVYEFMPNSSLDSHLFKGRSLLPWKLRFKIVQGLASGLLYLHEEGDFCVLHRDIKTNNIMLDLNFNAKLGDFGLARLVDHEKGSRTTLMAGTIGYMAPECHRTGKASKETDVYSFGVVALEMACGRRSIEPKYDENEASLVAWVWEAYENQRLFDVVDKKLSKDFDFKEMECLLIVGLWCAHPIDTVRPSIKQAMQVLNFDTALPKLPSKITIPMYDIPYIPILKTGEAYSSHMSITVPR